jgi:hypothetical protein
VTKKKGRCHGHVARIAAAKISAMDAGELLHRAGSGSANLAVCGSRTAAAITTLWASMGAIRPLANGANLSAGARAG